MRSLGSPELLTTTTALGRLCQKWRIAGGSPVSRQPFSGTSGDPHRFGGVPFTDPAPLVPAEWTSVSVLSPLCIGCGSSPSTKINDQAFKSTSTRNVVWTQNVITSAPVTLSPAADRCARSLVAIFCQPAPPSPDPEALMAATCL